GGCGIPPKVDALCSPTTVPGVVAVLKQFRLEEGYGTRGGVWGVGRLVGPAAASETCGGCGVLRGLRGVAGRTLPTVPRETPSVREADRCFYAVQKRSSRAVIRHQRGPPR